MIYEELETEETDEYLEGYKQGRAELKYNNPYKPSGHERDTTCEDEWHYRFWRGYEDARETIIES